MLKYKNIAYNNESRLVDEQQISSLRIKYQAQLTIIMIHRM